MATSNVVVLTKAQGAELHKLLDSFKCNREPVIGAEEQMASELFKKSTNKVLEDSIEAGVDKLAKEIAKDLADSLRADVESVPGYITEEQAKTYAAGLTESPLVAEHNEDEYEYYDYEGPTVEESMDGATEKPVSYDEVREVLTGLKPGEPKLSPEELINAGRTRAQENPSVPEGFAARTAQLVKDRGSKYGRPENNHGLTARLFSAYFNQKTISQNGGVKIFTAEDVCIFNILQKISRNAFVSNDDSYFDIVGYCENIAKLPWWARNKRPS